MFRNLSFFFFKLYRNYLQQEDTGTLMASTIHTMSILLKQMVMRDGGGSTLGPELLSGVQGSWVVAGTCLFRKFPLAVEEGSTTELLLGSSHADVVTFHDQCARGALSVPLSWPPLSSAVVLLGSVWPSGLFVRFCVRLSSVGAVEIDVGEVCFSGGIWTGARDVTFLSTASSPVGGSFTSRTSLEVMAWCACSLSLRPGAGSVSGDEKVGEVSRERLRSGTFCWFGSSGSSTLNFWGSMCCAASVSPRFDPDLDRRPRGFGAPLAADSTSKLGPNVLGDVGALLPPWLVLTETGLWTWASLTNLCMWPWMSTAVLDSSGWITWSSVLTVLGVTVSVLYMGATPEVGILWSKAKGWRATVGRMRPEGWVPPLVENSPLLEPSWCHSRGAGLGADRELLLWTTAIETGSWDVWLRYSSCADVTSPDSARNARTPVRRDKRGFLVYHAQVIFIK